MTWLLEMAARNLLFAETVIDLAKLFPCMHLLLTVAGRLPGRVSLLFAFKLLLCGLRIANFMCQ